MSLECVVNKATSTGEEASQHPCRRNQSKPKHASSKQVEYTHTHTRQNTRRLPTLRARLTLVPGTRGWSWRTRAGNEWLGE